MVTRVTPHLLRGVRTTDPQATLDAVRSAPVRAGVSTQETPSPSRVAPQSVALLAEVAAADPTAEPLASGRWVALHDPTEPDGWKGPWRIVTLTTTAVEPERADDLLVGDPGELWLRECLARQGCRAAALSGTTTRVTSEAFGEREHVGVEVTLEIRASWTPLDDDLMPHLEAWRDLLVTAAGLPQTPADVVCLHGAR